MRSDPEFEGFYRDEAQAVFASVYLLCRDARVAEDATQEAFARALERWERLRGESWRGGWVTTTAVNVARRGLRRPRLLPATSSPGPTEEGVDLWEAVARLPRRQQQVVVLTFRLGLSAEEIAPILRCRSGTVRTHLARAREALRQSIGGVVHDQR
jgi:RNA polymerase sigma-70 factor (ECF subfamily)